MPKEAPELGLGEQWLGRPPLERVGGSYGESRRSAAFSLDAAPPEPRKGQIWAETKATPQIVDLDGTEVWHRALPRLCFVAPHRQQSNTPAASRKPSREF